MMTIHEVLSGVADGSITEPVRIWDLNYLAKSAILLSGDKSMPVERRKLLHAFAGKCLKLLKEIEAGQ